MTVLTDVPESGVYFQQGAIVEIVAQIIDYTTGQPIQLQTATGLSIAVLYPDLSTSQVFAAELYTDGSDGRIVYTTVNDGTTIDLSQIGLYKFQGSAVIGGIPLPPSYEDDFYVLPNAIAGMGPTPLYQATTLVLKDSNGVFWGITVNTSGQVSDPVFLSTFLANYLRFNSLAMKDPNGQIWTVGVSTGGILQTAPSLVQADGALSDILLNDTSGRSWVLTISASGTLEAN